MVDGRENDTRDGQSRERTTLAFVLPATQTKRMRWPGTTSTTGRDDARPGTLFCIPRVSRHTILSSLSGQKARAHRTVRGLPLSGRSDPRPPLLLTSSPSAPFSLHAGNEHPHHVPAPALCSSTWRPFGLLSSDPDTLRRIHRGCASI